MPPLQKPFNTENTERTEKKEESVRIQFLLCRIRKKYSVFFVCSMVNLPFCSKVKNGS